MTRLLLIALLNPACPALAQQLTPFSIAVLPDTQYYARNSVNSSTNTANIDSPLNFFRIQTNWIGQQAAAKNIVFATHLGDVVNNSHFPTGSASGVANAQWDIAVHAMNLLRASPVPHGVLPGNHDWSAISGTGAVNHYRARFGDQSTFFSGKPWFLGFDDRGINSAQLFSTPAGPMLHLSLEFNAGSGPAPIPGASAHPLHWARAILAAHPNLPTIISTHNALNASGDRDDNSVALFNHLVHPHNQVFMVLSGHYSSATVSEQRITSTNAFGQPVYEMLQDYQSRNRDGDGWMRLLEFDPAQNRISVRTFTPVLSGVSTTTGGVGPTTASPVNLPGASFEELDTDSRFDLPQNFATRFAPRTPPVAHALATTVFRQGHNGYTGTHDTYITSQPASNGLPAPNGANPDGSNTNLDSTNYRRANWGDLPSLFVDSANFVSGAQGNTALGYHRFQSLLRFDDLFGTSPHQIHPNATITSATLTLFIGGPSDQPGGGTDPGSGFRLARLTRPFNEASHWDSLDDGINLGVDTLPHLDAPFAPAGTPTPLSPGLSGIASSANALQTHVTLDVTAALRAWQADPASNFCWALLEVPNGTNGTRFWSSAAPVDLNRPTLTIYTLTTIPEPAHAATALIALILLPRRHRRPTST